MGEDGGDCFLLVKEVFLLWVLCLLAEVVRVALLLAKVMLLQALLPMLLMVEGILVCETVGGVAAGEGVLVDEGVFAESKVSLAERGGIVREGCVR
jgi:hypothetical protein